MKLAYKNDTIEQTLIAVQAVASLIIVTSFALRFGFYGPPIANRFVIGVLIAQSCPAMTREDHIQRMFERGSHKGCDPFFLG